jgi:hypothetical protein
VAERCKEHEAVEQPLTFRVRRHGFLDTPGFAGATPPVSST